MIHSLRLFRKLTLTSSYPMSFRPSQHPSRRRPFDVRVGVVKGLKTEQLDTSSELAMAALRAAGRGDGSETS